MRKGVKDYIVYDDYDESYKTNMEIFEHLNKGDKIVFSNANYINSKNYQKLVDLYEDRILYTIFFNVPYSTCLERVKLKKAKHQYEIRNILLSLEYMKSKYLNLKLKDFVNGIYYTDYIAQHAN